MPAPLVTPHVDAALRYAALGWRVFPLHSMQNGRCTCGADVCSQAKHPRTSDGFKSATTDEQRIRGWWRTWPEANIGIATGAISGLFVLDVDSDKGGDATLGLLISEHGGMPQTTHALTGSGGAHYLFAHPGRHTPNSTQRLGPGLDVRGDGGYIVAAPSLHKSGARYEWQPDCAPWERKPSPAPAWLFELLTPPAPPMRQQLPADNAARRASAYLAKVPGAVAGQAGHVAAFKAAFAVVRGFRLSEGEAFSLLANEYNPRCDPPWSEKELLHKVQSAAQDSTVPYGYLLEARQQTPPPSAHEPEAPASAKRSRLNMQPVSVLLAEQIPPTDWLLQPYLEAGTIAALVAPPNLGKTLLAFWLATLVASNDRRVAIIEEEGGKRGFQKRLDRAVHAIGSEKCGSIDWTFKPRINLLNANDIRALADELVGYSLIILDSFARVTTGLEENDTREMGQVVQALDLIRERTGATILLIHHSGKTKWKPGEVPRLEDGRGSSALAAGIDTALGLAPVPDGEKEPGYVVFDLHVTKQRDEDNSIIPKRVRIEMTGPEAHVTLTDKPGSARKPTADEQRVANLLHLVLNAIPEAPAEPTTREAVQDKVGRRAADVRAAVNVLLEKGSVKELSRKRLIRVPSVRSERSE